MQSIWSESCKFRKREVLDKDIKTDTIIIGAGMAGILIGYMLKQSGIDVILIDELKWQVEIRKILRQR